MYILWKSTLSLGKVQSDNNWRLRDFFTAEGCSEREFLHFLIRCFRLLNPLWLLPLYYWMKAYTKPFRQKVSLSFVWAFFGNFLVFAFLGRNLISKLAKRIGPLNFPSPLCSLAVMNKFSYWQLKNLPCFQKQNEKLSSATHETNFKFAT